MHHAGVLSTTASQGHVLGAAAGSREGKWSPHSKDRGQVSECPGSAQVNCGHVLTMTFPNTDAGMTHQFEGRKYRMEKN